MNKDALRLLIHLYAYNKQYDLSNQTFSKINAIDSLFGPAYCEIGMAQLYNHQYNEAYENFLTCDRLSPQWSGKTGLIISLVKSGKTKEAKVIADQLIKKGSNSGTMAYMYFALGETDQGFEWLEKAYEEGDPIIAQLRDLPFLFPIESDQRYIDLIKQLNFPG